jgi:hypothetical protein
MAVSASFRSRVSLRTVAAIGGVIVACFVTGPTAFGDPYPAVEVRALDKVTARVSTFRVLVGETVPFGKLRITARACDKRPPEDTPEAAGYLEITELDPRQQAHSVFQGWMFASSPGLSPMEHPIYDVWVLDCTTTASATESSHSVEGR